MRRFDPSALSRQAAFDLTGSFPSNTTIGLPIPTTLIGRVHDDIVDGQLVGEPADELARWRTDLVAFATTLSS